MSLIVMVLLFTDVAKRSLSIPRALGVLMRFTTESTYNRSTFFEQVFLSTLPAARHFPLSLRDGDGMDILLQVCTFNPLLRC